MHYLKGWFVIDVLSTFPYDLINIYVITAPPVIYTARLHAATDPNALEYHWF